jgi:prepilin-type N-terminal cleavage/methylation domain-containing protein
VAPNRLNRRCGDRDERPPNGRLRGGFSLIELLVVIAIIGVLVSLAMPSLSRARSMSRLTVCLSHLRELGLAVQAYAAGNDGAIPRGPSEPLPYMPSQAWNQWATNQLWIEGLNRPTGLGPLFQSDLAQPRVLYCPADDTNDPSEELEKLERRQDADVFCSYLYRQLDQTTRDRFDDLGRNALGNPARALALDANSLAPGDLGRTNHKAESANVVYRDGHAQTLANRSDVFSIRGRDYFGFPTSTERRLNEILSAADFAESADPTTMPPLP